MTFDASMSSMSTIITTTMETAESISDDARHALADNCDDAAELRELGLMLDLFESQPDGSVSTSTPWAAEDISGNDPSAR